jgi:RNA polymerase sigma-70 factor (ECF subfamily)
MPEIERIESERRLIEKKALMARDPSAVESFIERTFDRTFSFLSRMLWGRRDIEDLTQEVYLKAWRSLPAYRGDCSPDTWLYRIAINVGRDAMRSAQRNTLRVVYNSENLERAADQAASRTSTPEDSGLSGLLEDAMRNLSEDHRAAIQLVAIDEHSIEEAAVILEVPTGTVKSRLHHARKQMREFVMARKAVAG